MLLAVLVAVAVVHVVHAQVATCPPAPRGRSGYWPNSTNPSCTLNGKAATCELFLMSTRPVNCTNPLDVETCFHYRSACVPKDSSCFTANAPKNCVVDSIAGRCTLDEYGLFYDCLPLGDSAPCTRAADGLPVRVRRPRVNSVVVVVVAVVLTAPLFCLFVRFARTVRTGW